MRKVNNSEIVFIKKIIRLKLEKKIEDLQSAKLLREQLNCIALKWTIYPERKLSIYYSQKTGDSAFYEIIDYLYLIKELEDNHYITLLNYTNLKQTEVRTLFDKQKVQYCDSDKLDDESLIKILNTYNEKNFFYQKDCSALFPIPRKEELYIDIINLLEKYATAIIYPLPLLNDFVNNDFKSIEDRNFDKQLNKIITANRIAIAAVLISILLGLIQTCSSIKINTNQFDKILNTITKTK